MSPSAPSDYELGYGDGFSAGLQKGIGSPRSGYNLPPGVAAEDIPDYVEGFDSDAELEAHNAAYELWEFSLLRNRREHQWKRLRASYSLTSWHKVKNSLRQWRSKQR